MALDLVSFRKSWCGARAHCAASSCLALIDDGRGGPPKFVLDTNCYVDASRSDAEARAFSEFCAWAAPGLYLSTVVAAELRAGAGSAMDRRTLERQVLAPYIRRGRLLTPTASAWEALGTTLATLCFAG
jgi:predicted nucleic acid-binding protein